MAFQAQANAQHLVAKQHAALADLAEAQHAANKAYAAAQVGCRRVIPDQVVLI